MGTITALSYILTEGGQVPFLQKNASKGVYFGFDPTATLENERQVLY